MKIKNPLAVAFLKLREVGSMVAGACECLLYPKHIVPMSGNGADSNKVHCEEQSTLCALAVNKCKASL